MSSKREMSNQCEFSVGLLSATLAKYQINNWFDIPGLKQVSYISMLCFNRRIMNAVLQLFIHLSTNKSPSLLQKMDVNEIGGPDIRKVNHNCRIIYSSLATCNKSATNFSEMQRKHTYKSALDNLLTLLLKGFFSKFNTDFIHKNYSFTK